MKTYFLYMMQKKINPLLKLPYEKKRCRKPPSTTHEVPFLPEAEPEMPKKGKGKGKEEGKGHFDQRKTCRTLRTFRNGGVLGVEFLDVFGILGEWNGVVWAVYLGAS